MPPEDAAAGAEGERKIAGDAPVDPGEPRERVRRLGVALPRRRHDLSRLCKGTLVLRSQGLVDRDEPGAGQHPLDGDPAKARLQTPPEPQLEVVGRGEAGVTGLRCDRDLAGWSRDQRRGPEAGAGSNDGHHTRDWLDRRPEVSQLVRSQARHGQGLGHEVIDQVDGLERKRIRKRGGVCRPRQVGEARPALGHLACDRENGRRWNALEARVLEIAREGRLDAGERCGRVGPAQVNAAIAVDQG